MGNLAEKIYNTSPVLLQNVLVSSYGIRLFYERYYRADKEYLNMLSASQWLSKDQIRHNQVTAVNNLFSHARSTVRFYRDREAYSAIMARGIVDLDELQALPVLDKETVRLDSPDLVSSCFSRRELIQLNTSGTTGKSLKVYVDYASRRASYCFTTRYHHWAGLRDSRGNATFGGRCVVPPNQRSKIFWRRNAILNNYLFSSYHMSDENLPHYIKKLQSIEPQYIEAYPSAAYVLASHILEHGEARIRPRAVLTSGETLFDYQRDMIERAFGCRVFDQYGCTEQALFVSQCEKGTYHVHPEYGIVEILDESGKQVPAGVLGRVVCTSFLNRAMPLIRYDLGDTAAWGEGPCGCGRSMPIITKIGGRQEDYVLTADGKKVGRLDPVFKGVDSVKLAQIVQTHIDRIELRIVPGSTFDASDRDKITMELRARVGHTMKIELVEVGDIPKTANGKIKAVVSMLGK